MRRLLPPLVAALLLAACASAPPPLYVPFGQYDGYGYSEEQLSETRYRVHYEAPSRTSFDAGRAGRERAAEERIAVAYDMALLRAAELALARGFPAFRIGERQNDVAVEVEPDYPYFGPPFSPFWYPGRFHLRHYPYYYPYYPGPYFVDRQATVGARVTLMVELRRQLAPDTLDAAATKAQLLAKYPNAAPAPAPAG